MSNTSCERSWRWRGASSCSTRARRWLKGARHEGEVLDMLVQRRRDTRAALRLMRKLLKKQGFPPKLLITHKAALLRVGVPAIRAELPSRTGDQAQQSSRELSSAGATARAQGAAIQVVSLRAALPEYACRRLQYLQSSTPSRLPIHAAKIPNRCCRAMEKRCHSRMMLGQFWLSMRTSFVAVTKPCSGVCRQDP